MPSSSAEQPAQKVHSKLQMKASAPCGSEAAHRSQLSRISKGI
jgi:hypothetical protein